MCSSFARFASNALRQDEAVIIVAEPSVWNQYESALVETQLDARDLRRAGRLHFIDVTAAHRTLTRDGFPTWVSFQSFFTDTLHNAQRRERRHINVLSELTQYLIGRREMLRAIRFEDFWSRLQREQNFTLLCNCRLSAFETDLHGVPLRRLAEAHRLFLPADDIPAFDASIRTALNDILGPSETLVLFNDLKPWREEDLTRMPEVQAAIFWLREHLPTVTDAVLQKARRRYETPGTA